MSTNPYATHARNGAAQSTQSSVQNSAVAYPSPQPAAHVQSAHSPAARPAHAARPQAQAAQPYAAPQAGQAQPHAPMPNGSPAFPQASGFQEQRLLPRGTQVSQAAPQVKKEGKSKLIKGIDNIITGREDIVSSKQKSTRLAFIFTAVFLFVFFILATKSVTDTNSATQQLRFEGIHTAIGAETTAISDRIGSQVKWIDTSLASQGSANQVVNLSRYGANVIGVAMIDASGAVVAAYPSSARTLSNISLANFPASGVNLTSLVSNGGVANPVIVRKSGDIFLMTMLQPGSLLSGQDFMETSAIVSPGGRVIDGSGTIATDGVLTAFGLSTEQLSRLVAPDARSAFSSLGDNRYFVSQNIPQTDLTLLSRVRGPGSDLPSVVPVFGFLFLSTALLLGGLLKNALGQIKALKNAHQQSIISQDRYRVAVDGNRGGVWEVDLRNNSVYINASLSRIMGMQEAEQHVTVSQFLGLFHEGDRERLLAVVRRAQIKGDLDIELRVAHLPIVLQCRGNSTIRGHNDSSAVILGVAMDITEQRGAQARLQAAEARLYDALNSMTDSFVVWDALGRLVLWNGKFEDFFGFSPGQLQPGVDQDLIEQRAQDSIEEFFEPGDNEEYIEIKLKDGRWIRYTESETADGGQVSIGTDITEIRLREGDLRENDIALRNTVDVLKKSQTRIMELAENYEQEKIRAEDANQSKSDFLANMSHELRTPLNAINGFSDIMKKEMFGPLGDPRYKEYVGDILFSGQHLLSLINDILDMSKIEAGKMTLNIDLLQIHEMISQVVRIVRGRAEEGRLKLIYEGDKFEEIEADQRAVKQVLLNLITNAIKFTPEGGTVRVLAERKSAGVIVKVIDSGIGISKENIERLAKPFEQIDTEHSKQQEGTGLGLALSKSLIELHGGNFLMESEPGEGTTVTFTLPNKPPVSIQDDDEGDEVGNEITRLAHDIAEILDQSEDNAAA